MDASHRLRDLILITGRLAEVLERENSALKARRQDDLKAILEEKVNVGRVYENRIQALTEAGDDVAKADPDLRARLAAVSGKAKRLMEENGKLLKVAIEANRRVVGMIAEAVKRSAPGTGTYSPKGAMRRGGARGAASNVALSYDQSL
jgi:hypothetical protein